MRKLENDVRKVCAPIVLMGSWNSAIIYENEVMG